MTDRISALPMYDWPEVRAETDAQWARIRDVLRAAGIDAPEALTRETGDLYDFWRRPDILFTQTCWGPMGDGLASHVQIIGQPDYSDVEGGEGELYRSAVLMRRTPERELDRANSMRSLMESIRHKRFAYNAPDSMSGYLALKSDLGTLDIFSEHLATGVHRASIRAVAMGKADVCAIDCRTWALAQLHEPSAADLVPVGWTSSRKGLPYITSARTSPRTLAAMRTALLADGLILS